MKVLLTGATGLLGSHILKDGLDKGFDFSILCREIKQNTYLHQVKDHPQIQLIQGDLLNLDFSVLPTDISTVIHAAALVSGLSEDKHLMQKINLDSTKKLYNFYKAYDARWVQISSVSTMCSGHKKIVNEAHQGEVRDTEYAKTKLAADNWLDSQPRPSLILHPCYMLGEWDARPSSGIILYALRFKKITRYYNSMKNFVSASDVANGVWQAIENQATGHFLLGNHNVSIKKFFELACHEMNMSMSLEEVEKDQIGENDFVKEFCSSSKIDLNKAQLTFGYCPKQSLEKCIQETLSYFVKFKMLPRAARPKA